MNNAFLLVVGVIGIVAALFSGLVPLPGQKDDVTAYSQSSMSNESPQPMSPKNPPAEY